MKREERILLQRRIRLRIARLEGVIKGIKKLNKKLSDKAEKPITHYMPPIDKESRKAISVLESIRSFNTFRFFKRKKTRIKRK